MAGIDVDADDLDPGGQQVAHGDRMQRRGDQQAKPTSRIACRIRSCASSVSVITSGSGPSSRMLPASRKSTFVLDAFVHDAEVKHARLDGSGDAARPADAC